MFVKLNTQELSTNIFEDKNINVNPNIRYYYKISTIAYFNDGTRTESKFSEPTSYKIETDNKWFKKINERNMWILKNDAVLMDLYVRKIDGEQCPKAIQNIGCLCIQTARTLCNIFFYNFMLCIFFLNIVF